MAVPDFSSLMLPRLQFAGDGKENSLAEARVVLAAWLKLTKADLNEVPSSARQIWFANRVQRA